MQMSPEKKQFESNVSLLPRLEKSPLINSVQQKCIAKDDLINEKKSNVESNHIKLSNLPSFSSSYKALKFLRQASNTDIDDVVLSSMNYKRIRKISKTLQGMYESD